MIRATIKRQPVPRPCIVNGAGAALDDFWAGRIVDKMTAALATDARDIQEVMRACGGFTNLGNVKAQAKTVARVKKAMGISLLNVDATFKSRNRFTFYMDHWQIKHGAIIGVSTSIQGNGPGRSPSGLSMLSFGLTRHALIRLVQRSGCQTPESLLEVAAIVHKLATMVTFALDADDPWSDVPTRRGWVVPLMANAITGEMFNIVMVLGDPDNDPASLMIPTILPDSMLDMGHMRPLRDVLEGAEWNLLSIANVIAEDRAAFRGLLDKTVRAAR